eukprot:CAMPEP_0183309040 /NCGR_PEP_ID=MMETSP0160_2-20130417/23651_1 /TAXON_ID=2839 ORGANISM="Odontella Sinensis, Strain Grunow 1884" /NCGR_SAMPLE_ID=MMETSP0160_2 /ASSEMBLY_ACC=CAM_ASM_000250 /LENGTH=126 /DNA_ID=CAMNT_0025472981 /DNA_START=171 /DNA_END=551 /DNA_ORIENTATION=+
MPRILSRGPIGRRRRSWAGSEKFRRQSGESDSRLSASSHEPKYRTYEPVDVPLNLKGGMDENLSTTSSLSDKSPSFLPRAPSFGWGQYVDVSHIAVVPQPMKRTQGKNMNKLASPQGHNGWMSMFK